MPKSPDAFRTISEVADWLGIQAHVLRFWESKFSQVKPVKRAGGRRYYRPSDMRLLGGIKKLLHDDGLTIKGVQKILREQGVGHVSEFSKPLDEIAGPAIGKRDDGATVLRFADKPAGQPEAETPAQPDPPPAGDARTHPPEAPAAAPETAPEISPAAKPAADPQPAAETETGAEAAVLPSFLHRPARPDPQPDPPATRAAPPPPRIPVVDAPDPPADTDIPYVPGALGQLAGLDRLTPEQARQIAPLAARLQSWLELSASTGPR